MSEITTEFYLRTRFSSEYPEYYFVYPISYPVNYEDIRRSVFESLKFLSGELDWMTPVMVLQDKPEFSIQYQLHTKIECRDFYSKFEDSHTNPPPYEDLLQFFTRLYKLEPYIIKNAQAQRERKSKLDQYYTLKEEIGL